MSAEERIKALLHELGSSGPMLPGTLSVQYNVCGKAGCRCKDPVNPVRHGPYCQLSFTVGSRSSTMFVKSGDVQTVRQMSNRWKRFKELGQEMAEAYIEIVRKNGVSYTAAIAPKLYYGPVETVLPADLEKTTIDVRAYEPQQAAVEPSSTEIALKENRDQWKSRALQRTVRIAAMKNTIRDLQRSRESWRRKAREAQGQLSALIRQQSKIRKQEMSDDKKKRS